MIICERLKKIIQYKIHSENNIQSNFLRIRKEHTHKKFDRNKLFNAEI